MLGLSLPTDFFLVTPLLFSDFLVVVIDGWTLNKECRRLVWWTRMWWTRSLVKRKCIEHLAHQFEALAKAVHDDDDWESCCKVLNQDLIGEGGARGGEEIFVEFDWRTLAIPKYSSLSRRSFCASQRNSSMLIIAPVGLVICSLSRWTSESNVLIGENDKFPRVKSKITHIRDVVRG